MTRPYAILGAVLLVVVGLGAFSQTLGRGDDRTMIQQTLRDSLEASRQGKSSLVLETLSSSLAVNDNEARGNFGDIAKFIKNQKPDIEVENQEPVVTGDEARITSPVKIRTTLPPFSATIPDVVLVFKRETGREYLVFPVKKWRLSQVQAPEGGLGAIQFGG